MLLVRSKPPHEGFGGGQYEIQVYIYRNSSLKLESTTKEQCIEIPQSGIGGFFGLTQEKCFDIEIPSQIVSSALSGGGKENYLLVENYYPRTHGKTLVFPESRLLPVAKERKHMKRIFGRKKVDGRRGMKNRLFAN